MSTTRALRADAKLNRDRLLDVAREALAKDPLASLNLIAKMAQVGPGTLYRHFPTREALVLGVYHKEIQNLVALAPELARAHPPVQAFRLWCRRLALYGRVKHGLGETLHAAMTEQDYRQSYGPMVVAVRHLLEACEASNDFSKSIDPEDVLLLLGFFWRIKPSPDAEHQAERLLEITIRGLSASDL